MELKIEIDKQEFFKNWEEKELAKLSDEDKENIIKWFINRNLALKRDNYKCQNQSCTQNIGELSLSERRDLVTVHHLIPRRDFKENPQSMIKRFGYECDDLQNLATLCKYCHIGYEKAKLEIVVNEQPYELKKPTHIDYKRIINDGKKLRRELKKMGKVGWYGLTEEERTSLICLLMRWLTQEWTEIVESY